MLPEQDLLDYILDETYTSRHILLIDPANQSPEKAAQRCIIAVEEGTRMIFVGGSTNTPNEVVHQTCLSIQEALELRVFACSQNPEMDESFWQVPVVLFPGGSHALSPAADAITFMMLMNSQSRKWLVGEQMKGAPVYINMVFRHYQPHIWYVPPVERLERLAKQNSLNKPTLKL